MLLDALELYMGFSPSGDRLAVYSSLPGNIFMLTYATIIANSHAFLG